MVLVKKSTFFFTAVFWGNLGSKDRFFFNILDTKEYIKNIEKFANF